MGEEPEPRKDAVVRPEPIRSIARVHSPGVQIRPHLWLTWGEIAIDEEANARAARADELAIVGNIPNKEGLSEALLRELKASLVCIAAVSHSLDALFGVLAEMVIEPNRLRAWHDNRTRRAARVLETLKRALDVEGSTKDRWRDELDWLFIARNSPLHFREEVGEPVPHPSGTSTSAIHRTYSKETAERAVNLLLEVLSMVVESPKEKHSRVVKWAEGFKVTVDLLRARRGNNGPGGEIQ